MLSWTSPIIPVQAINVQVQHIMSLSPILLQASELGIRLEIVNGLPIWEAQPVYRHQKHIGRIVNGIAKPGNGQPMSAT